MVYFLGDDLFAVYLRRGLPIGNLISQFWANCYLNRFDHFVIRCEPWGCPAYLRFVDDYPAVRERQVAVVDVERGRSLARLAALRLTIHEKKAQVKPTTQGIPFLGFTVYPTHRRLKRSKGITFRRKLRTMLKDYRATRLRRERIDCSVRGWLNHVRYGDTWGLRTAVLKGVRL